VIEDRQISVETSGGYRPPTGMGERILLVMAGMALVGGALIAVGNLLPEREGSAEASPQATAEVSARPSRTPRPAATPTPFPDPPPVLAVVPGTPPPVEGDPYLPGGWARALVDLPIYESPSVSARVAGTLAAGELIGVESFSGEGSFVPVYGSELSGWVQLSIDDTALAETYPVQQLEQGTWLSWLLAGSAGYIASAYQLSPDYSQNRFVSLSSADGITWQASTQERAIGWDTPMAAWGPAGWLSATTGYDNSGPQTWLASSSDGAAWTRLGRLDAVGGSYPLQLVASDEGYLLALGPAGRFPQAITLWFSTDGLRWEQRPSPGSSDSELSLVGMPGGFLGWADASRGPSAGVAFSREGFDWAVAEDGPTAENLQIAPLGPAGALAVGRPRGASQHEAWIGRIADGRMEWQPDESARTFGTDALSALAGYETSAVAIGWDSETAEARAWQNRGAGWERMPTPAGGFGTLPVQVAAGPYGYVVVGARPSLLASNPVFWRSTGGQWRAEASPVIPALADPTQGDCEEPISDALAFLTTPPPVALVCARGEPISFTAWSVACEGCYGGMGGTYTEEWLSQPTDNLLFLSPVAGDGPFWHEAVIHPDLSFAIDLTNQWLRVTGHYDDPAAERCGFTPDPIELGYWFGYPRGYGELPSIEVQCRLRFVVTAVEPLGTEPPIN
jgi:hypothetical protein